MPSKANIKGLKFHNLLVIEESGRTGSGKVTWKCLCECGKESIVSSGNLSSGSCKTCGCGMYKQKHGFAGSKIYQVWAAMKQRCHNMDCANYENYGGRGITVCDRWKESFENFYEDMGNSYEEGLSIERVNNDREYCKENCKWATQLEQAINKRKPKNTSSIYRGVQFLKRDKIFRANSPKHNGKIWYLGLFESEVEAAKCVDNYIVLHKLKNHLNFNHKEEIKDGI